MTYHAALYKCAERYRLMAARYDLRDHEIRAFIREFEIGCIEKAPVPKLCRWLGYIQGVLIERGLTTVEEERNWTRPLFRPLDFPGEQ